MNLRVLMIEDSALDAELIEAALRRSGYDLSCNRVMTLDACASALESNRPDLVICDHNIPPFLGSDVLSLVRAMPDPPPFILITGSLDEETAVNYMKAGASDYILKDRLARLGSAVRAMLERDRDRRAKERAEAEKREAEARLSMLVRATNDAVWDLDLSDRSLDVNEGFRALIGYAARERLPLDELYGYVHDEDRWRVKLGLETVLDSRASFWTDEYRLRRPDGSWATVMDRALVMRNDGGRALRVVGAMVNITETQKLQQQLQQAQKMEAVGRLAGGIAHDFNNVLTTILMSAHLLQSDSIDARDVRSEAEAIQRSAERAAALTRQLLAFSRKQVITLRKVNLNHCIDGFAGMLQRIIGDVQLKRKLSDRLGAIRADTGQLEQILLNLAVNARDAMPTGGVLLIRTSNVNIDEQYAREHIDISAGPYVLLSVSDTGTGMDQATRERIFEPFFTTKGGERGTGLGLSTVYGIVRQHGGTIAVYSEPGHGTTFRIYLPRVEGEPDERPTASPANQSAGLRGREILLLVEDEVVVRNLTKRILERYGYTVLAAEDAADARRLATEHGPKIDLLITDIVMPGINGPDLARQLASAGLDAPVLFLSGYSSEYADDSGFLTPGSLFLSKPFTPPLLAEKVREALASRG